MRTWLFSSSTERPVDETMMRFILELERADSRLRARASTTTSLPSYPLTVMPPLTRLASTRESDRKSTRLNSSHGYISYAVFCLKKKKKQYHESIQIVRRVNSVLHALGHTLADDRSV